MCICLAGAHGQALPRRPVLFLFSSRLKCSREDRARPIRFVDPQLEGLFVQQYLMHVLEPVDPKVDRQPPIMNRATRDLSAVKLDRTGHGGALVTSDPSLGGVRTDGGVVRDLESNEAVAMGASSLTFIFK